jgi:hypothetical protein
MKEKSHKTLLFSIGKNQSGRQFLIGKSWLGPKNLLVGPGRRSCLVASKRGVGVDDKVMSTKREESPTSTTSKMSMVEVYYKTQNFVSDKH